MKIYREYQLSILKVSPKGVRYSWETVLHSVCIQEVHMSISGILFYKKKTTIASKTEKTNAGFGLKFTKVYLLT